MPWLVVGGVLAVYFLLTRSSQVAPASSTQLITGSAGTTGSAGGAGGVPLSATSKAPTGGVVGGTLSTLNNLSITGCAKIASAKGVPVGLATTGCQAFSYLTPLGAATAAYKYGLPALTYAGGKAVDAAEYVGNKTLGAAEAVGGATLTGAKDLAGAVASGGNMVKNAASSAYNEVASWF